MKTFTGKMEYDPEVNLWVARQAAEIQTDIRNARFVPGILKRRRRVKTLFDRHGHPVCKVTVNDSGQGAEHEFDSHQDAVAMPLPIILKTEQRSF